LGDKCGQLRVEIGGLKPPEDENQYPALKETLQRGNHISNYHPLKENSGGRRLFDYPSLKENPGGEDQE
jgi:hypothetical protein